MESQRDSYDFMEGNSSTDMHMHACMWRGRAVKEKGCFNPALVTSVAAHCGDQGMSTQVPISSHQNLVGLLR